MLKMLIMHSKLNSMAKNMTEVLHEYKEILRQVGGACRLIVVEDQRLNANRLFENDEDRMFKEKKEIMKNQCEILKKKYIKKIGNLLRQVTFT